MKTKRSWVHSQAKQKKLAVGMDKLQLTGRNLGPVFNFRSGHLLAVGMDKL